MEVIHWSMRTLRQDPGRSVAMDSLPLYMLINPYTRRGKSISPDLPDINPRRIRRPSGFRVDIVHPVDNGKNRRRGYGFFSPVFRLASFVPLRPAVPPGGPNPPDGSAAAPVSGAPGAQPFRFRFGSDWLPERKRRRDVPPPGFFPDYLPFVR